MPCCADPSVLGSSLLGHTDAVWGLSLHSQQLQLLSCSADGTVRLWNPQSTSPLLSVFSSEKGIHTLSITSVSSSNYHYYGRHSLIASLVKRISRFNGSTKQWISSDPIKRCLLYLSLLRAQHFFFRVINVKILVLRSNFVSKVKICPNFGC